MLVTAVALAALLSACSSPAPPPVHTAALTATPVFASDAEALAAAEAAYAKYQAMEDTISHEGGKDPDRIRPFASRDALEEALAAFAEFQQKSLRTSGAVNFDHAQIESYAPHSASGLNEVLVDSCIDVSGVDLIDDSGTSVISPDRVARQPFRLTFDVVESSLVVASRERIENTKLCE
ncbi:hypothetical protein BH11ACT2_BH11ACT2_09390 [soil metagenome]